MALLSLPLILHAENNAKNSNQEPAISINSQIIDKGQLAQTMRILAIQTGETNEQKLFQQAVNDIVLQQLSYQLAEQAGFANNSKIKQQIELLSQDSAQKIFLLKQRMMIDAWQIKNLQKLTIEELTNELQARYQSFIKNYQPETEVQLAQILVASQTEALEILKQLRTGKKFSNLAKIYSLDQLSAQKGGDMGYLTQDQLPPELAAVVFSLPKNTITNVPVVSAYGYHIFKILNQRKTKTPSFHEIKPILQRQLAIDTSQPLVLNAADNAKIYLYDKNNKPLPLQYNLFNK